MTLRIYLLGQFKLQADDLAIELPSRPAQSLLAYLTINAGVTYRREMLACMLWPEATDANARSYLRQALWRIRKALEKGDLNAEEYLIISDISLAFNNRSSYWLDAALLTESAAAKPVEELIETVRLYRGELLPGFYEEWVVSERERLQAAYYQKMDLLLAYLIRDKQWHEALKWGEQWIRLGYSPEPAFRALMHAHTGLGDQTMVSATYQRCVEALDRELGLDPSPETVRLYERILRGELDVSFAAPTPTTSPVDQTPVFLKEREPQPIEKTVFVARERELAQLERHLELAFAGKGRVIFVSGEAGSGKSALIHEFTRRAQEAKPDLIVASGNCNAHTGLGDPYLPFREILGMLTGDVEARWAAGAITREHARRLWKTLPVTARALLEAAPDLIDTFVPGAALVERAMACTPSGSEWSRRLDELVKRKAQAPGAPGLQQRDLFEQYTRALQHLARQAPLVLVADDLQWADLGSINLLFHLGRGLAGNRILILGAYRPEEVALDRGDDRHPLKWVLNELKRELGDIIVDLDQAESRDFLEAMLDSEPNRLGAAFREMLYQQTRGNPLTTIELLRGMQERGDLVFDQDGNWIEGPNLDWDTLPARVEAVIAARIDRLTPPLLAALRVACVEGETFTAEVVARVRAIDERALLASLSEELDRVHRLVRAQSILRIGDHFLSTYRFQHILFQKYLYNSLDEVERVHLHEQVGNTLEELYGAHPVGPSIAEIAPQLARHFQEAKIVDKTVHYLQMAGDRAFQLSAYQEALTHLNKGLELLMTLPDSPERARRELSLQLALGLAWIGPKAYGAEVKSAYNRARQLCQQLGKTRQLSRVVGELAVLHYVQADLYEARELAEDALDLAQQAEDPMLEAISNWHLGFIRFSMGEYAQAQDHLKHLIDFYDPQKHHRSLISLRGSDAGVSAMSYQACCLWCLGYPEQAWRLSQKALALARQMDHPFSLTDTLCYAGCLFNEMRRNPEALRENATLLIQLSDEQNFGGWLGTGTCYHGSALVMLEQVTEGMAQIHQGMAINEPIGVSLYQTGILRSLSEGQGKAGQAEKGLTTLEEALDLVEETGERHWEAELHRLKAELLLIGGEKAAAEASLEKALQVARRQGAKSWELRAAIDLARLWREQGRREQARDVLGEVYNWFTEGFDTPDLKGAKVLLDELH